MSYTIRRRRIRGQNAKLRRSKQGFALASASPTPIHDLADLIKADIRAILMTEQGTVYGQPLFGVGLQSFLFEPISGSTAQAIAALAEKQIRSQYPVSVSITLQGEHSTSEAGTIVVPLAIQFVVNDESITQLIEIIL